MKSFYFDFLHNLRQTRLLVVIVMVILISLLGASTFSVSLLTPSNAKPTLYEAYYEENGSYHIVNFVYDSYGNPIHGIEASLSFDSKTVSRTMGSGFVNFTFNPANISNTYNVSETFSYLGLNHSLDLTLNKNSITDPNGTSPWGVSWGNYDRWIGRYYSDIVFNKTNPYTRNVVLLYVGQNDSKSEQVSVLAYRNTYGGGPKVKPVSLGTYSDFYFKKFAQNSSSIVIGGLYYIAIDTSDNNSIPVSLSISESFGPAFGGFMLRDPTPSQQVGESTSAFLYSFFPAIFSLISIFLVYTGFARLKYRETMGSIISKPISRKNFVFSRFSSSIVIMLELSVISLLTIDIYSGLSLGYYLPAPYLAVLIMGLFLTGASYISLYFMISALTNSDISFIGIALALVFLTSIFWIPITWNIATGISGQYLGSYAVHKIIMLLNYFSPAGSLLLSYFLLSGNLAAYAPTLFDPTITKILSLGLVWTLVPMLILLRSFLRGDL